MIKANFAIDPKVWSKLPKNKQELFTHIPSALKPLPQTYFYKLQERMLRIWFVVINACGGFFDEKKIYKLTLIKLIIILYSFWFKLLHDHMQTEKNQWDPKTFGQSCVCICIYVYD